MAKLHELIAVRQGLISTATQVIQEARHTFRSKANHFIGFVKRYLPFEDSARETESEEEHQEMVTTVSDKLDYVSGHIQKWLDAELQMAKTNQSAKADIVLDTGEVIATDVPGTFLLNLEDHVKQIRELVNETPTLQPGVEWKLDEQRGPNIYIVGHPERKFRTKKVPMSKVLYDATEQHPAQISQWHEDVKVGRTEKTVWAGMLTPLEKSKLLARVDAIFRAVKKARQRANEAPVVDAHIGAALMDYILREKTPN